MWVIGSDLVDPSQFLWRASAFRFGSGDVRDGMGCCIDAWFVSVFISSRVWSVET
jgi:hypothetical protein